MILAMAISTVVIGGLASTLLLASRAVDDSSDPAAETVAAAAAVDQITADLRFALTFTERTPNAVTFTVPDRDGDDAPETIRYSWSGNASAPLLYQYKGGDPVVLVSDVQAFDLTYLTRTVYPPPQACCFGNGACLDERPDACADYGGAPQGKDTTCGTIACPRDTTLLFVEKNEGEDAFDETGRIALLEYWGYSVHTIDDAASAEAFSTALAQVDVVYVPEMAVAGQLGAKLTGAAVGVVSERADLVDELELCSEFGESFLASLEIVDDTHYITSALSSGPVQIFHDAQPAVSVQGDLAPDLQILGRWGEAHALAVLEQGATLLGGGPAPGRRVQLPWGGNGFDFAELDSEGRTIMRRAVEWAAAADRPPPYCGDASCDPDEDSCSCPSDCGSPEEKEEPNGTCADGRDNDCDNVIDCEDTDCKEDPGC
jgi:hypothetical protein